LAVILTRTRVVRQAFGIRPTWISIRAKAVLRPGRVSSGFTRAASVSTRGLRRTFTTASSVTILMSPPLLVVVRARQVDAGQTQGDVVVEVLNRLQVPRGIEQLADIGNADPRQLAHNIIQLSPNDLRDADTLLLNLQLDFSTLEQAIGGLASAARAVTGENGTFGGVFLSFAEVGGDETAMLKTELRCQIFDRVGLVVVVRSRARSMPARLMAISSSRS
jgi:hypothetical protein